MKTATVIEAEVQGIWKCTRSSIVIFVGEVHVTAMKFDGVLFDGVLIEAYIQVMSGDLQQWLRFKESYEYNHFTKCMPVNLQGMGLRLNSCRDVPGRILDVEGKPLEGKTYHVELLLYPVTWKKAIARPCDVKWVYGK